MQPSGDVDPFDETLPMGGAGEKPAPASGQPEKIGRYLIQRKIGEGGFGEVFLAIDESLQRAVALKVINRGSIDGSDEGLMAEGRTLAQLNHPGIVTVHDIGKEDGRFYFVSAFVEGRTLGQWMQAENPTPDDSAALVAEIADALGYAHGCSIVHRDIKPTNIIITPEGAPILIDFGIALAAGPGGGKYRRAILGTPTYMSPEQARGESHIVDGRSDIYSLGVILYEMLTGHRPFGGRTEDLLDEVASPSIEVRPPRQIDAKIPKAIERVCLKALAKRTGDRYPTALDFGEDLRAFISKAKEKNRTGETRSLQVGAVVPKGLRSFDKTDSDFFLRLLPGLRDQAGIPDGIRFWKQGIDNQVDPFRVGVLYGPSGSGKSSFLKAGLLPLLPENIEVIYVSADAGNTERILSERLHERFSDFSKDEPLSDCIRRIRMENRLKGSGKLLIVIDQFEQWLHANGRAPESDLVSALRQCDGKAVQVILTLRDDFWMAISQLMEDIDVELQQSKNTAAIDQFDIAHARRVLIEFGRAYERFPADEGELSDDQREFVRAVLADMEQDHKIIPLQLALFAEMAKSVDWTWESYGKLGGVAAVGVAFLDSVFSDRSANPAHRAVEKEARAILEALLPGGGEIIRGGPLTEDELIEKSGLESNRARFATTMAILDRELRLVTPADAELVAGSQEPGQEGRRYQLTHDFLVETLARWLNRKKFETRQGRAELLLRERAELWAARPEAKQFPSLGEWIAIVMMTGPSKRSEKESKLMRATAKHHLKRLTITASIVAISLLAGFGLWRRQNEQLTANRIDGLVTELWRAKIEYLPGLIDDLEKHPGKWEDQVVGYLSRPRITPERRTRGRLALARRDAESAALLHSRLLEADAPEQAIIRDELRSRKDSVIPYFVDAVSRNDLSDDELIRAAVLLADYAPDSTEVWESLGPRVIGALTRQDPLTVNRWVDSLLPAKRYLVAPAVEEISRSDSSPTGRSLAASLAVRFGVGEPEPVSVGNFVSALLHCDIGERRILMPAIESRWKELREPLLEIGNHSLPFDYGPEIEEQISRQAIAIEILFRFGDEDAFWNQLGAIEDPRLRTVLIERIPQNFSDPLKLCAILDQQKNAVRRQALVLAFRDYPDSSDESRTGLSHRLEESYLTDPDPGVRLAAAWVLRSLGATHEKFPINSRTMIPIEHPGRFMIGSPENEPGRDTRETRRAVSIDYSFEIGATEVTVEEFLRYQPNFSYSADVTQNERCPVTRVSIFDAMKYCRWLNEQDPKFNPATTCYPPASEIGPNLKLSADFHKRPGFRLPTIFEREYACRAGSKTAWFFGDSAIHLDRYFWSATNSKEMIWPVALKRPNVLGLFDVCGNVAEWGHRPKGDLMSESHYRGGSYRSTPKFLRSSMPGAIDSGSELSTIGFRLARITVPVAEKR